jgi:Uma2 family endonuclease
MVLSSPADLELEPDTAMQPDVFVIPSDTIARGDRLEWSDVTHLTLAIEVLSPGSLRTDRVTKRDFYLDSGVDEYWIVDLDARVFERWLPSQTTPEIVHDQLSWRLVASGDPFVIHVPAFFEHVALRIGR